MPPGNTGGANNKSMPRRRAPDTGRAVACSCQRDEISGAVLGAHEALSGGREFTEAQRLNSAAAEGGPLECRVGPHM